MIRDRPPRPRSRVLDALDEKQRRELADEIRARRTVVAGDEPVLDRLARARARRGHLLWVLAAAVLAFLPAEIADPGGVTGAVRAAFMVTFAALGTGVWRAAGEAERYLDRSSGSR